MTARPTLVVVGAGHVAAAAARGLRRRGFDGRVIVLGDEPTGPYQRPMLSKERLTSATEDGLWLLDAPWCAANDVEVRTDSRVERIAADTGEVLLFDGSAVRADLVLVATGGQARQLPGVGGARVHHVRTLADTDRLRERLQPGRRIGVLGGGFLGTEVAAAARSRGADVVVVDRDPVLLSRVLGADIGAAVMGLHRDNGVELALGQPVQDVRVGPDGVHLSVGATTEVVDDLVVCIGIEPDMAVALRSGLRVSNGIDVDAQGRTSLPTVFAAGDVAAHDHPRYGRVRVEHVDVAQQQAAAIAATIAGRPTTFDGPHWFWTDQYDVNLQGLGLSDIRPSDVVVTRGDVAGLDGSLFWLRHGVVVAAAAIDRGEDVMAARELIDLAAPVDPEQLRDDTTDLDELVETLADAMYDEEVVV
ncbi:FAD-dependent oxidoreductase [Rhodococcus sp. X156]|uniref:NAD(P)/FAD-dependent oxidoreductase n=1 Tax=Rhodococcus sp. X156 TaxID=2499145 RepID=UPI000FDA5D03|nr:FAD-dependent oxidoreductase [Rhodococcus sp. X156]